MKSRCRLTLNAGRRQGRSLARYELRSSSRFACCVSEFPSQVLLDCYLLKLGVWSVADAETPSARSRGFGGTSDYIFCGWCFGVRSADTDDKQQTIAFESDADLNGSWGPTQKIPSARDASATRAIVRYGVSKVTLARLRVAH